jgi:hypothetical protein
VSLTRATKDGETTLMISKPFCFLGLMIGFFMEVASAVNFG